MFIDYKLYWRFLNKTFRKSMEFNKNGYLRLYFSNCIKYTRGISLIFFFFLILPKNNLEKINKKLLTEHTCVINVYFSFFVYMIKKKKNDKCDKILKKYYFP